MAQLIPMHATLIYVYGMIPMHATLWHNTNAGHAMAWYQSMSYYGMIQ